MNFCSTCGSADLNFRVPEGDHLQRYCCNHCQTIHYQNPNMVVGAIATWGDKVLLAKRNIQPRKGFWNLPCGFLELNETVEQGAKREVKEETGVETELGYLHTVYNLPHANQVYLIFVAKMLDLNFMINQESAEIELFTLDDIPWNEMAFSSNTFALKKFIDDKQKGFSAVHFGTFYKNLE